MTDTQTSASTHDDRRDPIQRLDYRPPAYGIDTVELSFELDEQATIVRARMAFRRAGTEGTEGAPLVLVGEEVELLSVAIDGETIGPDVYELRGNDLVLPDPGAAFTLETEVRIDPAANTALSGLYVSSGNFCTQCEAEGFRRITYFLDRPDVMARYTTTIVGDPARYPVMLSNGNPLSTEDLDDGRRRVTWEDPFPKPSYLFALVAGKLECHAGSFTTRSGRDVRLEIWVEPQNIDKCDHALRSLQRSMKWDEDKFGLEYDLDLYMIVAVGDFNMGAMENKGLNVFNSKYVLARPETATDDDYEAIEGVIGHEYFHNWTGNRVTCRDWFQLTLKEGLTVFRDQQFSADMTSPAVKRIDDVKSLRLRQLPEDAGPMAHPIRPESYIEMDNFYTATVYEKGAEVIRMYHTLVGAEGFRKGMDLYFDRHDGAAVTCDDFRAAMADANGRDLGQFERWYLQAGTPKLVVAGEWDESAATYTLTLRQEAPFGQDAASFEPLHVPVRVALVGEDGEDLSVALEAGGEAATERVLELHEREERVVFHGATARPVPSLLRGFSAPVELSIDRSRAELAFLLANDRDPFNRWDAGQTLFGGAILDLAADVAAGRELLLDPLLVDAFRAVLEDDTIDGSIRALTLGVPPARELAQKMEVIDPDALHTAREFVLRSIAVALRTELVASYEAHRAAGPYANDKASIDRRRAQHCALAYLTRLGEHDTTALAWEQLESADNMTDAEAALVALAAVDAPERGSALAAFYERWRDDPLVLDKWFAIQATSPLPGAAARVRALVEHADFQLGNPNRVRSVVAAFGMDNLAGFHEASGEGYRFLAEHLLAIDPKNPQLAARLAYPFNQWRRFDAARQALMKAQLERIAGTEGLSRNSLEIVGRALDA